VDDPRERVDKTDGRNVQNKMFYTLSPTALPTLRPQQFLITIITIFLLIIKKYLTGGGKHDKLRG